jgi:hypothetical protein
MYTNQDSVNSAAPPTAANVPTKAEEKKLRRSRRLAPGGDTNGPPEQFLELAPLAPSKDEKAKARRKEKRRAQKLQKKQMNKGAPNQVTGGKA